MKRTKSRVRRKFIVVSIVVAIILLLTSIIPIKLAIAYAQAPSPQAILILGGGRGREEFAAKFAKKHPDLHLWLSTGVNDEVAEIIFQDAEIPKEQVHLDRRATDTVTNFTTLVDEFNSLRIQHSYLITSDYHMPRSRAIAALVFGSRGIAVTSVSFPTNRSREPRLQTLRDCIRSVLWIATGHTGASLRQDDDSEEAE